MNGPNGPMIHIHPLQPQAGPNGECPGCGKVHKPPNLLARFGIAVASNVVYHGWAILALMAVAITVSVPVGLAVAGGGPLVFGVVAFVVTNLVWAVLLGVMSWAWRVNTRLAADAGHMKAIEDMGGFAKAAAQQVMNEVNKRRNAPFN
jgi:hypothetical protein